MGPPGKAIARPRPDSNRPVLGDLTPNAKLDKQLQQQQRGGSPLKRQANILEDGKGFSYIKRRRLSHNNALTRRITPQPNQDTLKAHDPNDHDPNDDSGSGRSSQNSNATRGSFSSLINYDPSSQQHISLQQQHHQPAPSSASMSIRTAAQTLRLRLRIAIYKVRTNQINVPFSRLQILPPPTPYQWLHLRYVLTTTNNHTPPNPKPRLNRLSSPHRISSPTASCPTMLPRAPRR
jgi:hypothetical protein